MPDNDKPEKISAATKNFMVLVPPLKNDTQYSQLTFICSRYWSTNHVEKLGHRR